MLKKSDFYFDLPDSLIAQTPLARRDHSRLLVLNKEDGGITHRVFTDLPDLLRPGDCLVLNDSRVIPARLFGAAQGRTGAPVEVVLLRDLGGDTWECLTRPGRKTGVGARLTFGNGELIGEVIDIVEDGKRLIRFSYSGIFLEILDLLGMMPLPPYIKVTLEDKERYQTVYSRQNGSAAAPTAGLHFTHELLRRIEEAGISIAYLTLHVGLGTFRPVKEENITDHIMHAEYFVLGQEAADAINRAKAEGGRVVAVGTTSCRTLETVADKNGSVRATAGWTDIFIYPGYTFKTVDALLTNFHLPESTLIMLVSAFAGRERVLRAYKAAISQQYRFFSFGDAMLIL